MSGIEERFSAALHSSARNWRQALDRRMKDVGISQAGWMTVALEGPSMVAMLDRLMKAGLIVREPSPTDRRIKLVMLTDAGVALYGKVKTQATAFRKELLTDIDPGQLRLATELLEQLQRALEAAQ
jgi:MarR family transcriptional regulator for hemolysin